MIVIGVVGGIGSGKSLVSQQLEELGAEVLQADRLGHDVLREPAVRDALRGRWGETVLDAEGEIDRKKVAGIVFAAPPAGPEELAFLEQVTHPRIAARMRQTIAQAVRPAGPAMLVLDAALLLEAGWDMLCDKLLFVDAPRTVRLDRAGRRGWTQAEFDAREAAQMPLADKRARADFVIDNASTPEHTRRQLNRIWQSLTAARPGDRVEP